jgi:extradiol dioxygenase family protein
MKFNKLIPEFFVSNFVITLDFYVAKLGFMVDFERSEDKFAQISFEGSQIMIEEDHDTAWITKEIVYPRGRGINFQIEVNNLDELARRIESFQIPFFRTSKEVWYRINDEEEGVKEFLIQDPDGYLLRFQQYLGQRKCL